MTRGDVCRLLGVSARTLSNWENDGKIPAPVRDWRGWRGYSPEHIEAIRERLALRGEVAPRSVPIQPPNVRERLSARNRLCGVITRIEVEGLMAEVTLRLGDGQEVVAIITRHSVQSLGLSEGDEAFALIKSTEVMIGR